MGAWGAGSFENDDAADWLADFCGEPSGGRIANALSTVAEMGVGEYLEAPECSVGLAAAEVVAALKGLPHPDLPEQVRECVTGLKIGAAPEMVSLASRAVERIKTDSELKELWDESEDPGEWYAAVGDLAARLKQ